MASLRAEQSRWQGHSFKRVPNSQTTTRISCLRFVGPRADLSTQGSSSSPELGTLLTPSLQEDAVDYKLSVFHLFAELFPEFANTGEH